MGVVFVIKREWKLVFEECFYFFLYALQVGEMLGRGVGVFFIGFGRLKMKNQISDCDDMCVRG